MLFSICTQAKFKQKDPYGKKNLIQKMFATSHLRYESKVQIRIIHFHF